ncbi:hypothetical protein dsmv_0485 [Desulfococcus multivorans DSM 2059]|uniref:Uncharacterized protein n=1 Tax=Desulfococcus multivorans DSM 2059 TaxID=1121405 RepID=S7TGR6_DESML|nr:hypothetical protein dsmv_0485 [Desulfococcus multivorans DSM 2059]SJZ33148.1 hypothetical protein SAMN02745446_00002 [Desulfococcus multivorans DSM 2059]
MGYRKDSDCSSVMGANAPRGTKIIVRQFLNRILNRAGKLR